MTPELERLHAVVDAAFDLFWWGEDIDVDRAAGYVAEARRLLDLAEADDGAKREVVQSFREPGDATWQIIPHDDAEE